MENNTVIEHSWSKIYLPRDVETLKDDGKNGNFAIEPLEKGYATFIGNSLRRILLSSLHGSAVIMIRITNVEHEFSSIPNVLEDVATIILNLKKVRFRYHQDGLIRLKLSVKAPNGIGSYYICARDIDTSKVNKEPKPNLNMIIQSSQNQDQI